MIPILVDYKNLILQAALCLTVTFFLTILRIPTRFLEGLYTYIHPENLGNDQNQSSVRAAIRRPQSTDSSSGSGLEGYKNLSSREHSEPKKRNRSKDKFEFDESNAQIFRLRLVDSHLESRLYFAGYRDTFVYSIVALSSILLHRFLPVSEGSGTLVNGALVPVLLGLVAVCKIFVLLGKVSFERSASKRSEKQISILLGFLGFLSVLSIVFGVAPSVFDFELDSVDGLGKFSIAVFVGCLTGFLFMPATKSARSFWLGTDQLRWNLSIISCGWIARMLLYINLLVIIFASLLWINPFAEMLVNKNSSDINGRHSSMRTRDSDKLAGNIGMAQSDFTKLRLWCLLVSGLSQIVALRPNLQMYLNEAVLSWYQRLHASKVPDLDFSRAKIFLHNYYLCLVVLQFFAPSMLVLLFLGLSQFEGDLFTKVPFVCGFFPCSVFVKEVALFMAWWVVFVWTLFTSASLVLYRRGFLYVS
ncbi:transmembrane protein 161B [Telopea speciosissima]|uniref:transmembrane protein 161B n=1 Tax=Telopea speciosissima TaxID=54955 RepID=UPI001CC65D2B|nr:transmembrane protein 161B [Telopea speciosissima]